MRNNGMRYDRSRHIAILHTSISQNTAQYTSLQKFDSNLLQLPMGGGGDLPAEPENRQMRSIWAIFRRSRAPRSGERDFFRTPRF